MIKELRVYLETAIIIAIAMWFFYKANMPVFVMWIGVTIIGNIILFYEVKNWERGRVSGL